MFRLLKPLTVWPELSIKPKTAGPRKHFWPWTGWHLITHIPNKGEQMVRYYGYYSNKARGMRKKADTDMLVPALIDTEISKKEFRKNWSRLIQKIYHADPLVCPKCSGKMRIISFIEEPDVIKDILLYLDLWAVRNHDPPMGKIGKNYIPENIPEQIQFTDEIQFCDDSGGFKRPYEDDYSQIIFYAELLFSLAHQKKPSLVLHQRRFSSNSNFSTSSSLSSPGPLLS